MSIRDALGDRLLARRNGDGSFGYGYRAEGAAEPTALAALALGAMGLDAGPSLAWLASVQQADGGVPAVVGLEAPCWPTGLALLAWERAASARAGGVGAFAVERRRAEAWLLAAQGLPMEPVPGLFGHDVTLIGWAWADGTHSWVEPTSYALLALAARARALREHPRVRQGAALLRDRCLPGGGWNYGNTRVLENVLRPFPATTGAALAALAAASFEAASADEVERSARWLLGALDELRAPFSLGWALVGLRAVGRSPDGFEALVERAVERALPPDPRADALLALAWSDAP